MSVYREEVMISGMAVVYENQALLMTALDALLKMNAQPVRYDVKPLTTALEERAEEMAKCAENLRGVLEDE